MLNDNNHTLKITIEFNFTKFGVETPWGWEVRYNNKLWGAGTAPDYEKAIAVFAEWKLEKEQGVSDVNPKKKVGSVD